MATSDDVRINIIAETKQAVASMASFAAAIGAAILVAKKLIDIGKDMVNAYGEQEQAEARLATAIKSTGREAEINQKSLSKLASQLQSVTTYGDEVTVSAMAMVQQLSNLNQEGLEKVTPAMLDFAAAMGVDLQTAASLIGKTLGSTTNALTRYGIEIDATAPPTEKLAQLTEALNEKFGGTAVALGETTLGKITRFKNAVGDLKEVGGALIGGMLTPVIDRMTLLAQGMVGGAIATEQFGDTWDENVDDKMRKFLEDSPEVLRTMAGLGLWNIIPDGMMPTIPALAEGKIGIDALTKGEEDYAAVTKELNAELSQITEKEKSLSDLYDDRAAQVKAVEKAITDLVEKGYKFEGGNIQTLLGTYGKYLEVQDKEAENYGMLADVGSAYMGLLPEFNMEMAISNKMFDANAAYIDEATQSLNSYYNMLTDTNKAVQQYAEDIEVARVESGEMNEHLEKQKDLYEQIAASALPLFEAMGASIVDASKGWEAFKEAAKDAIVAVLMGLAKQEAIKGIAMLVDPLTMALAPGHLAAAAAASVAAGFVSALGEGGIVNRPTMALIGENGPEAVVPLGRGGMGGVNMQVNVYGNLLTERQLVDGVLRRAAVLGRTH